jgi:hypothetical protein
MNQDPGNIYLFRPGLDGLAKDLTSFSGMGAEEGVCAPLPLSSLLSLLLSALGSGKFRSAISPSKISKVISDGSDVSS